MPYIKKQEANVLKKQLKKVYDNDGDWRTLASSLGVKTSTAYRWVKSEDDVEKQRGGRRKFKIGNLQRAFMERKIEMNPRITLDGLKIEIQQEYGIVISKECVRQHLDGLLFTLKDIRREPERANTVENKEKRRDYAQSLLDIQSENKPILYMDETNFNLFISRKQGRSKKGNRCTHIAAGCKGANIHLIGCIGNMGLIHYEVRRGPFKKPEANEFIRSTLRIARQMYQEPVVMVTDNAPCHASFEEVFQEEEFAENRLLRLSPYSPMFNPIESAWSSLKAGVKRDMAEELNEILNNENRAVNVTQKEFRMARLENVINRNIPGITVAKCTKYIAHIQKSIPGALNLQDVTF